MSGNFGLQFLDIKQTKLSKRQRSKYRRIATNHYYVFCRLYGYISFRNAMSRNPNNVRDQRQRREAMPALRERTTTQAIQANSETLQLGRRAERGIGGTGRSA